MTEVSEVADGIYQIETGKASAPGPLGLRIHSIRYFIANGQAALIDIGPAVVVPAVLDAIRQLGYDPYRLSYLILTHIHLDHAGGAGTLAQQFPQLQVLVHQRGARHLIDPKRLIEGTRQAWGERFEDVHGPILPVPERQVRAVEDRDVISLGDKELRIIYAPGHAPHQMCIYETKSQGVFSGDSIGAMVVAGFDLDATLETIDKLTKLNPKIIFGSHFRASREATRHLQSVRVNTKAHGDIILEAMRAGEDNEKIAQRLEVYQIDHPPSQYQPGLDRPDRIITWYVDYFKRKGFA